MFKIEISIFEKRMKKQSNRKFCNVMKLIKLIFKVKKKNDFPITLNEKLMANYI